MVNIKGLRGPSGEFGASGVVNVSGSAADVWSFVGACRWGARPMQRGCLGGRLPCRNLMPPCSRGGAPPRLNNPAACLHGDDDGRNSRCPPKAAAHHMICFSRTRPAPHRLTSSPSPTKPPPTARS